ncbi:hypothetical protein [Lujinxingia litoralis]|nr:hypothetical protein [Lujinxingia litoralis]
MHRKPSVIGELLLWALATVAMVALAVWGTSMMIAKPVHGFEVVKLLATGVLTLTWGSWAGLIWSRRRISQTLMRGVILVPGLVMALGGLAAFVYLPDVLKIWKPGWLLLAAHGMGAVLFSAVIMTRPLMRTGVPGRQRSRELVAGWLVYPLVSFGAAALFTASFMGWFGVEVLAVQVKEVALWMMLSLGLVLYTTAIPAGTAMICRRLAQSATLKG